MATDVTMPRLSDSMEEGTILKWLVEEGGEVKKGEPLVEIETDKANMTYDADTSGVLIEVVADEGDTLPIGEVIARIGEEGEKPSGAKGEDSASEEEDEGDASGEDAEDEDASAERDDEEDASGDDAPSGDEGGGEGGDRPAKREPATASSGGENPVGGPSGARSASSASSGNGASAEGERIKASPVARRMASDLGVELAQLEGSGPGGRIVKADVEAAAKGDGKPKEAAPAEDDGGAPEKEEEAKEPAKAEAKAAESGAKGDVETQDLTRLQKTVSRRMAESKATAPDYTLHMQVDMSLCVELRKRLKEVEDPAPSFNDMIVKAAANALREHPRVNGAYRDGRFELYSHVNVGVAVAAQDTLVVPTIFEADTKSLGEIARQARALIEKVRDGKITPPEVSGGTFTVSNLGMYGVDAFSAVINPPQAAILTVGSLKKRPIVDEDGRVVARDTLTLSMVSDHRILYGADAAQFLARVRELLEQPLALAL
ncbi:MAG: 2-oxo acid dehydrogenase subunit E2 [Actinomycetota bacterium]|nr:2-oxo acid dehydrogenase subunit E2 [Actinomycetota bacterium]